MKILTVLFFTNNMRRLSISSDVTLSLFLLKSTFSMLLLIEKALIKPLKDLLVIEFPDKLMFFKILFRWMKIWSPFILESSMLWFERSMDSLFPYLSFWISCWYKRSKLGGADWNNVLAWCYRISLLLVMNSGSVSL